MAVISCTVVLAPTNPSAVFDNGVLGLASPLPLKNLHDVQTAQVKEEVKEERWDIYPWKQKTYGDLFFDQVAELENLTPVMNEEECNSFSDFHLGQGTSQSLFEDIQDCLPASPWSSSANSEDKESSDDSISSDRDDGGAATSSASKRKKITVPSPPSSPDEKVLDKRVRNNQASKKFRQLRKGRHKALFDHLQVLENENYELNVQLEQMIKEINHLKSVLPEQELSCMSLLE